MSDDDRLEVADMTALDVLDEPSILENLRKRHAAQHAYTSTGDIVIAVNPYAWLEHLYTDALRAAYGAAESREERAELAPHVFGASARAFHAMRRGGDQSVLVSGESGALCAVNANVIGMSGAMCQLNANVIGMSGRRAVIVMSGVSPLS